MAVDKEEEDGGGGGGGGIGRGGGDGVEVPPPPPLWQKLPGHLALHALGYSMGVAMIACSEISGGIAK